MRVEEAVGKRGTECERGREETHKNFNVFISFKCNFSSQCVSETEIILTLFFNVAS